MELEWDPERARVRGIGGPLPAVGLDGLAEMLADARARHGGTHIASGSVLEKWAAETGTPLEILDTRGDGEDDLPEGAIR